MVGPNSLPANLNAAELATIRQAVNQAAERAMNVSAASETEEESKEEASSQIRESQEAQGGTIEGESRGAHSFELKKEEEEEKEEAPPEEKPPDPEGRGRQLDIQL